MQETTITVVELAGPLTIATAAETRATLLAALPAEGDVAIDCRAATACDVAFVQLLESARRLVEARGGSLRLAPDLPRSLRGVLAEGGFAGWLEEASEPSA